MFPILNDKLSTDYKGLGRGTNVHSHFRRNIGGSGTHSSCVQVIWPWSLRGGEASVVLWRRESGLTSSVLGELAGCKAELTFDGIIEHREDALSEPSL